MYQVNSKKVDELLVWLERYRASDAMLVCLMAAGTMHKGVLKAAGRSEDKKDFLNLAKQAYEQADGDQLSFEPFGGGSDDLPS